LVSVLFVINDKRCNNRTNQAIYEEKDMYKMRLIIALAILAIMATACAPAAPAPATPDLAQMQIAVQQTLDFEKAVNAQLTQAAQTDQALAPVQQPPTQEPPTQQLPQPTVYVTPSVPMLSVSMDTNCREGPNAEIWKSIGGVFVGDKAEIVAKYVKGHWYIVKLHPTYSNAQTVT
jgi:hypothetical protein